jgi:succinate-acetate transporter protein
MVAWRKCSPAGWSGKRGIPSGRSPSHRTAFSGLVFWGLFTFAMFIGTLRLNRSLQVVFATLVILFWLLAIRDWTGSEVVGKIAGWEGIICGLSAIYAAVAQILNEVYGKVMLPIGPVKK